MSSGARHRCVPAASAAGSHCLDDGPVLRSVRGEGNTLRSALAGSGRPLRAPERRPLEGALRQDFSDVRIHADPAAAQAAAALGASALTVGHHVLFGRDQYSPHDTAGRALLAHELVHVAQQDSTRIDALRPLELAPTDSPLEREADAIAGAVVGHPGDGRLAETGFDVFQRVGRPNVIQRTPAGKVSCAPGPLDVPATAETRAVTIADPVGVITAAETTVQGWMDTAIDELGGTRDRILAGEPIAWPTVSDTLARCLQIAGLDPNSDAVWRNRGVGTAHLLLTRLRLVRRTIGAGSFFFRCLGSARDCADAEALTAPGSFTTEFCHFFWTDLNANEQAGALFHEAMHNFAVFVGHAGRRANAECFVRFCQVLSNVAEADQRLDLCDDP